MGSWCDDLSHAILPVAEQRKQSGREQTSARDPAVVVHVMASNGRHGYPHCYIRIRHHKGGHTYWTEA